VAEGRAGGGPPQPPPAERSPAPDRPAAPSRQDDRPAARTVEEIGGPKGPEPTRYGDWEQGGRCTDF
jgi:hypothetical protein